MNDKGIHSHNTLRAMYWFAAKVDLCNQLEKEIDKLPTPEANKIQSGLIVARADARDNLADMALRAVISGDIEQEEQC